MKKLIPCEFNMGTACVELVFADGSMISINCTAVENEVADNIYQRSKLDLLFGAASEKISKKHGRVLHARALL